MSDRELIEQLDQAIAALVTGAGEPLGPTVQRDDVLQGLVELAQDLRDLPDDRFKTRLAEELFSATPGAFERRTPMTDTATVNAAAIHTVTPYLSIAEGARLIEFMKEVFGAEELARHNHGPEDAFHSMCKIGDTALIVAGGAHARRAERPMALHVFVADCDATYQRALAAGASPIAGFPSEPADRPYGERSAFVVDAFGNYWYIGTRLNSHYLPEGAQRVIPHLHPQNSRALIDFLKRAFGAEEIACHEQNGRVAHAEIRLGESLLEMGDADRPPVSLYVYTDDVDALYASAVAAGGVSLSAPNDRFYGDRTATVRDPFGNEWTLAKHLKDVEV